ncbi:hypothetical protein AGMMS49944_08310 [Spirochaetia bacterium]|nr:hypothetical protein AGMMS49944_08310 [Spirochaetia bacterium]
MKLTESGMEFDFSAFNSAKCYDTPENQCAGLKIVDFIAENDEAHFFIEVKNYVNVSANPLVQIAIGKRQKTDYLMLNDPVAAFPLEIGMKFKDSMLRWLASGNEFTKPIALLLIVNLPTLFQSRDIELLRRRITGYIPDGINTQLEQFPKMTKVFFDMMNVAEGRLRYGVSVSVQSSTSENA